jgi:hypothetical protein
MPRPCSSAGKPRATGQVGAKYDIRGVQELLGRSGVSTTMMYTHVLKVVAWPFAARQTISERASYASPTFSPAAQIGRMKAGFLG